MFSSNASTVSGDANYIEDVFSTYLYTGTGAAQSIVNNIDLSTEGGMVWIKNRAAGDNFTFDTARGVGRQLWPNLTDAAGNNSQTLSAFNTNGFSLGIAGGQVNTSADNYASWTFRKQPKFFDVVTYTGTGGTGNRQIAHSLGSVPGFITLKKTSDTSNWTSYHRSLGANNAIDLNNTGAAAANSTYPADPTSTYFEINAGGSFNLSGQTYVAYIFAHDAGGFGLTGTDNVISCGSFTTNGSAYANVNLGYEPQWVLQKRTDSTQGWYLTDNMRGSATLGGQCAQLFPNTAGAESSGTGGAHPTATGFESTGLAVSANMIYIAIRRGPMKVPTDGTTVFTPVTRTGTGAAVTVTGAGFPPDFLFNIDRFGTGPAARYNYDRLRGAGQTDLRTNSAAAEGSAGAIGVSSFNMNGFSIPSTGISFLNSSSASYINYFFGRAPSFFDEVCYTGTGAARTLNHNLGVAPQLIIVKGRTGAGDANNWAVSDPSNGWTNYLAWNTTSATAAYVGLWNDTAPTATVFSLGDSGAVNQSSTTYLAYLFASAPGVSKVGSYTGTATTQQINCGFTAGSRFVMIKRTDSTGDWYVWDSARGIVAGNDPYLFFNDSAAEVTSTDYVDTYAAGFELTSTAPAALNASGGTYIFLAIA